MREGQGHPHNPYHKILFNCNGEQTADTHEWTLGFWNRRANPNQNVFHHIFLELINISSGGKISNPQTLKKEGRNYKSPMMALLHFDRIVLPVCKCFVSSYQWRAGLSEQLLNGMKWNSKSLELLPHYYHEYLWWSTTISSKPTMAAIKGF